MKGEELIKLCKVYKGEAQNPYSDFENKTIWEAEKKSVKFCLMMNISDKTDFSSSVSSYIRPTSKEVDPEKIETRRKYYDLSIKYLNQHN